ncbi:hypothetical protein Cni_G03911 [Canna indica]|uniref:Uncharacterized protein n=1 Tax=Canna indica TaxID=4628 RepID=A0AAQ3JUH8_9LILI|nr:hypothetical protein Cni_G03911 [Canna indica]
MALTAAASYVTRRGEKGGAAAPVFRADYMFWWEQQGEYMERRQVFLRSYHFSRKQPPRERVRGTLLRVRRLVWARLRDARRLPRLLWSRLRRAFARCRAAFRGGGRAAAAVGNGRRRHSHRLAAGGLQFQRLAHRRTASNSSSGSSAGAEWPIW